jgi:hypothetical protein
MMAPKRTLSQRREANQLYQGRMANAEGAAIRIGQYGQYWQPFTVNEFARRHGWIINFANFWDTSDSGKKAEGTHHNGYTFVMDSTRHYYRVQNPHGDYVDADLRTINDEPYKDEDNKATRSDMFLKASHFSNESANPRR